jgi:type IV secretory pathway VirB10-like protein
MDETPEELERIRREAEDIDVHQYQKRFRALKAIGLGAALAGLVWLVMIMLDSRRNPCERLRDYVCRLPSAASGAASPPPSSPPAAGSAPAAPPAPAPAPADTPAPRLDCAMYQAIFKESVEDDSPQMRQSIRAQCVTKIDRLKAEDGVTVH